MAVSSDKREISTSKNSFNIFLSFSDKVIFSLFLEKGSTPLLTISSTTAAYLLKAFFNPWAIIVFLVSFNFSFSSGDKLFSFDS